MFGFLWIWSGQIKHPECHNNCLILHFQLRLISGTSSFVINVEVNLVHCVCVQVIVPSPQTDSADPWSGDQLEMVHLVRFR